MSPVFSPSTSLLEDPLEFLIKPCGFCSCGQCITFLVEQLNTHFKIVLVMFVCNSPAAVGVNIFKMMKKSKRVEKQRKHCINKQLEFCQRLSLTQLWNLVNSHDMGSTCKNLHRKGFDCQIQPFKQIHNTSFSGTILVCSSLSGISQGYFLTSLEKRGN